MSDNAPRKAEIIQLYDDVSPELRRVLERKLGNAADAEEILQDAFEKLLRLSDRQHIRDLRRYFFTMANNMALKRVATSQCRASVRSLPSPPARNNTPSRAGARSKPRSENESLLRVQVALAALPERTRHVFLLYRSDGLSYREIARTAWHFPKGRRVPPPAGGRRRRRRDARVGCTHGRP